MVLGFKRRFEPLVVDGSKRHSIRAGERWRPGMICDCFVDPRQKTMRLLGRWECRRVEVIRIEAQYCSTGAPSTLRMWVAGEELTQSEVNELCWRDGFRTALRDCAWIEFCEFWVREHRKDLGRDMKLRFTGQLIHWDYDHPVPKTAKRRTRKAAA